MHLTAYEEGATATSHELERLRHENAILYNSACPPSEQDHEVQDAYHHLSIAEHGWNYTYMLLDITREEVKIRTHMIVHLEHHVDEVPTGEEWLVGTFFLNERTIIILFDYGASHDFMSSTHAKKAKLSLVASGASYVISSPGGRVDVDRIVQKVLLELSGRIFSTNLIILSGQGIDVIFGIS
jgi:hypothetical protein